MSQREMMVESGAAASVLGSWYRECGLTVTPTCWDNYTYWTSNTYASLVQV